MFSKEFLERLRGLRFTGDMWAIPEGKVVFATEPLLRVTAPLVEAQLVETFPPQLHHVPDDGRLQGGARHDRVWRQAVRRLFRFRTHGADAALKAARASYVGGASATSNVLAGKSYGIEVTGTMAHSYVMAFRDEIEAFRAFARDFPGRAVLLIDTFDTAEGARRAVHVAREFAGEGTELVGVRLDSGDINALAREVRKILDDAGLADTKIIASGDLDEYRVKQIFRSWKNDRYDHDVIGLHDEELEGEALLQLVLENGRRTVDPEPLDQVRSRCRDAISHLPERLTSLRERATFEVGLSERLEALVSEAHKRGA